MQGTLATGGVFRGAEAITDYLNTKIKGGPKLTRSAVYRMIEERRIPVVRLGKKRTEVWAVQSELDKVFGGASELAERESV